VSVGPLRVEVGPGPTGGTASAAWRSSVLTSLVGKSAELVTLGLLGVVVPRALGPEAYGRFAVPLTVVTLGSLALALGGPTTMARFVPAAPPERRLALARRLGVRLAVGSGARLAGLAAIAAAAAAIDPQRVRPMVAAVVVGALALNVLATCGLQVGLGLGRAGPWSLRYPVQNLVLVLAVLVLHPVGGDDGALLALVVAGAVAAALGLAVAAPVLRHHHAEAALPREAIRFGVLHAGGAALTQVAHRGGVVAVALLAGAGAGAEAGYTSMALSIALGVTYAVLQLFTVSLPHLVGSGGRADVAAAEAASQRLCAVVLAVLAPAGLVGAALLGRAVPAVFGSEFADAAPTFGPALALVVLAPLHSLGVQVAALRLRAGVSLAAGAASALTFAVVALAAVPAWGAPGGTAAALAGVAAGTSVAAVALPGALPPPLLATGLASAALVVGVALVA